MHTLICESFAFAVCLVYGSFFEWTFHRYFFHSPKIWYRTFKEHTMIYHQIYDGGAKYTIPEDHDARKVAMDWWAMPLMMLVNAPLFLLVQWLVHAPTFIGSELAVAVYFLVYESLHYVMHVPATMKKLSQFAWFRFIDDHHKVHHKYMLSNLNVILPIADYTLGTMRDRDGKRIMPFWSKDRKSMPTKAAKAATVKTVVSTVSAKPAHMVK